MARPGPEAASILEKCGSAGWRLEVRLLLDCGNHFSGLTLGSDKTVFWWRPSDTLPCAQHRAETRLIQQNWKILGLLRRRKITKHQGKSQFVHICIKLNFIYW